MIGRDEIATLAREQGFVDIAEELAALALPSLRLEYVERSSAVGASKLGGAPDLPADIEWPRAKLPGHEHEPMTFFGQIALADLDSTIWPGPQSGLLSFFCRQPADYHAVDVGGAGRVLFISADASLARRDLPPELPDEFRLGEAVVTARPEMTLPTIAVYPADVLVPFGFAWDGPRAEQEEAYMEFLDRVADAQGIGITFSEEYAWAPTHRLLGWPEHVQGDVLPEIVMMHFDDHEIRYTDGELERHAPDWRLLLQVEADRRVGANFGDGGTIYFGLPAADLASGRFDRAQAISQSG